MNRITTAFVLISAFSVMSGHAAETRPWHGSVNEALEEAGRTEKRILVDLYADWCGWCKKLEADVFSTPAFQEFSRDFVLLRVDTEDGAEGTELQRRYEALSLPTTLVIDENRILVASIPGYSPAPQYIASIQAGIDAYERLIEGYERFKDSTDPRVLAILADELHKRMDGDRAAALYTRILALEELPAPREVRLRYQLADALRLAEEFTAAAGEIERARAMPSGLDSKMKERFDLLAAQVAIDQGDCSSAETALEAFLIAHPASDLKRVARQTLASLRAEGHRCS